MNLLSGLAIGNTSLSLHLLFETLAMIVGFRYFLYLKSKQPDPIPENNRIWIIIAAALGAFLFSRLLGACEDPAALRNAPNKWVYFYASKTIVGGLLGGLLFVEWVKKILHEKSSSGDLFTYPLILAIIIGRIGCVSAGLSEPTYGVATGLPWGIDQGDGVRRHPVALYEIIFLLVLWAVLKRIETSRSFRSGIRFQLFMISYLVFRLCLEFIKPTVPILIGLSSIQFACIAGLFYYRKTIILIFSNPIHLVYERPA